MRIENLQKIRTWYQEISEVSRHIKTLLPSLSLDTVSDNHALQKYFHELAAIGIRVITPPLYIGAQTLATTVYLNNGLSHLNNTNTLAPLALLISAHIINNVVSYRLLRNGGNPINMVTYLGGRVLDKTKARTPRNCSIVLSTSISEKMISEMGKLGLMMVSPGLFNACALVVGLGLSAEAAGNIQLFFLNKQK